MNKKNETYGKVLEVFGKIVFNTLFLSTMLFALTNGQVYAVDSTPKFEVTKGEVHAIDPTPKFEVTKGEVHAIDPTSDSFSAPTQEKTVWILGDPKDSVEYSDGNIRRRIQYIRYGGTNMYLKDATIRIIYDDASKAETDLSYNHKYANKLEGALIRDIRNILEPVEKALIPVIKKILEPENNSIYNVWSQNKYVYRRIYSSINKGITKENEIGTIEVYKRDEKGFALFYAPIDAYVRLRDSGGPSSYIDFVDNSGTIKKSGIYEIYVNITHRDDCWKENKHLDKLSEEVDLLDKSFKEMEKSKKNNVVFFSDENKCKINIKKPLQLPASYNAFT